jgi:hypothetical protein
MELINIEVAVVEKAVVEANEAQLRELNDLQLVMVGGGIGDPIAF